LVGIVLSSSTTLAFLLLWPENIYNVPVLSLVLQVLTILGRIFAATGFFVAFYAIALALEAVLRRVPGSPPELGALGPVPRPPVPIRVRGSWFTFTVLGGAGVALANLMYLAGALLPLLFSSYVGIQLEFLTYFVGAIVEALGFVLAFFGIALALHRIL